MGGGRVPPPTGLPVHHSLIPPPGPPPPDDALIAGDVPADDDLQQWYRNTLLCTLDEIKDKIREMFDLWGSNDRHRAHPHQDDEDRMELFGEELMGDRYPGPLASPIDFIQSQSVIHNTRILVLHMCWLQKDAEAKIDGDSEFNRMLDTLYLRSRYLQMARETITLYLQTFDPSYLSSWSCPQGLSLVQCPSHDERSNFQRAIIYVLFEAFKLGLRHDEDEVVGTPAHLKGVWGGGAEWDENVDLANW